jgi:hypothetical protein
VNFKPSDFFIGIIDFFGILIPGLVLYYFHGSVLLDSLNVGTGNKGGLQNWVLVLCSSYILGHFLLGFSIWLNDISVRKLDDVTWEYFYDTKYYIILPRKGNHEKSKKRIWLRLLDWLYRSDKKKRNGEYPEITNAFYAAFSFLRLNSTAAMAELERQTAESKLFRSLCLLFIIDFLITGFNYFFCFLPGPTPLGRPLLSLGLVLLTWHRFDFLFDWTYRLAFDFFLQIHKAPKVR